MDAGGAQSDDSEIRGGGDENSMSSKVDILMNMKNMPPKVFVSHASADKDRFVIGLATKLRGAGVDAWLDRWEMNPGDSLVDKIFDEGLKNCQAMIVVISRNSIDSKWVREELNIGMVRKIEQKAKLIPIRLDGCEMPVCLRATVWEDVSDLSDYETQFRRVLNGINGQYDKPPLGTPPAYVLAKSLQFAGLTRIDSQVFEILCSKAVDTGSVIVEMRDVETELAELGITDAELIESQEVLRGRGYVEPQFGFQQSVACMFQVLPAGFEQFLRIALPNYRALTDDVARKIVNRESMDERAIAGLTGQPQRIISHILDGFARRGLIRCAAYKGIGWGVQWVSPELGRNLS
jgi:hypothetical protein